MSELPNSQSRVEDAGAGAAAGPEPGTILGLIRSLHAKEISGKSLAVADRRRVVEYLTADGYSVAEVAEILGVVDRTILRDRQLIREQNSLQPSPELAMDMMGRVMAQAETTISHLRRAARDPKTKPAERIAAERACWEVMRELALLMQRMGYLPTAPQQVNANINLDVGIPQLEAELERVERVVRSVGDESAGQQVLELRNTLTRLVLAEKMAALGVRVDASAAGMDDQTRHHTDAPGGDTRAGPEQPEPEQREPERDGITDRSEP